MKVETTLPLHCPYVRPEINSFSNSHGQNGIIEGESRYFGCLDTNEEKEKRNPQKKEKFHVIPQTVLENQSESPARRRAEITSLHCRLL